MERTIQTDIGPLHVDSRGDGPTLLCWPSLFCDGRTVKPLVDEFSRDHRVLVVDGPGHGRSAGTNRRFSMEACADAGIRVLDAAGVKAALWVGAAWGGHVGAVAAIRHPGRLRALVIMNSPMAEWSSGRRRLFWSTWWMLRLLGRPRSLARKIASSQIAPARLAERPELLDPIVDCIVRSPRAPFLAAVRSAMLDRPSLLPRLGAIRVPTLFLTGAEDGLYPVEVARAHAAAIPGARFQVIPGTAHQSLWESPGQVLPELRSFFRQIRASDDLLHAARA